MNPTHLLPTETATRPAYERPQITTFTSEELLERLGPAQTCSPAPT